MYGLSMIDRLMNLYVGEYVLLQVSYDFCTSFNDPWIWKFLMGILKTWSMLEAYEKLCSFIYTVVF